MAFSSGSAAHSVGSCLAELRAMNAVDLEDATRERQNELVAMFDQLAAAATELAEAFDRKKKACDATAPKYRRSDCEWSTGAQDDALVHVLRLLALVVEHDYAHMARTIDIDDRNQKIESLKASLAYIECAEGRPSTSGPLRFEP
ncbi:MAG: hypothetical protein OXS50_02245 [Gammaproteobacteria bacterium]|nr:hypothetical protein [Gammaproteobacteria bacterium]